MNIEPAGGGLVPPGNSVGLGDNLHPPTEQARLEAAAVVASRVSRDESHKVVTRAVHKIQFREIILVILIVAVAALAYRNATESGRIKAGVLHQVQITCKQNRDVALLPLPESATILGLSLIADFRNAYYENLCAPKYGPLPKPDPRLLRYLDPIAR